MSISALSAQRLGDALADRAVVGDAEDEILFTGEESGHVVLGEYAADSFFQIAIS